MAHSAEHPLEKAAAESDEQQLSDKMICIIQQRGDCTKEYCQRSNLDSMSGDWVRALSVRMHLGLKMGTLWPITYCQIMAALFLHRRFSWPSDFDTLNIL